MDKPEHHSDEKNINRASVDQELILELNFVPDWARKSPTQANYYAEKPERRSRPTNRDRDQRRPQRPRSTGSGPGRGGRPDRDGRRSRPDRRERAPAARRPAPQPRPEPPPVDVRFLPDRPRLLAVVKKMHATGLAYPIVELASLFLSNPESCCVRIDVRAEAPDVHILQCGKCGAVAMEGVPLLPHILDAHMDDYFEKEEILIDPPSGKFVCIARCGLSGILLGPPNHHSHEAKAREIHNARYPHMSFPEYKQRIEQLHDEELIEKWKEESRKKTVYRSKESPEAEPITLKEAEKYLDAEVVPNLISSLRRVDLSAAVARDVKHSALREAVSSAWHRESRFPTNLSVAIRGAFRHSGLYIFKAGNRHTFVTATRPAPLDKAHVTDQIREALVYLTDHPGCSRRQLLEGLHPECATDSPEAKAIFSTLHWLAERGHIIEFFDGALAVPLRAAKAAKQKTHTAHRRRRKRKPPSDK